MSFGWGGGGGGGGGGGRVDASEHIRLHQAAMASFCSQPYVYST